MPEKDDWKARMRKADEEAASKARTLVKEDIEILMTEIVKLKATAGQGGADPKTYAELLAVVEDATRKNESTAQVLARVKKLGDSAMTLAKDLVDKIP
jgi:hypothetical protein